VSFCLFAARGRGKVEKMIKEEDDDEDDDDDDEDDDGVIYSRRIPSRRLYLHLTTISINVCRTRSMFGCNGHTDKCAMRNNLFRFFFFHRHFKTTFFFFIFNLFSQFMILTTHPPPKKSIVKESSYQIL